MSGAVSSLLAEITDIGRDLRRGGYSRPVYSEPELRLRDWFVHAATARGLSVETDRNGAVWAWWDLPGGGRTDAVATGSHLDSVPGGGEFDGPLGVASALAAVDVLRAAQVKPTRPLAIAVFPEEEGSRYGVACLGSRLMTGAIDPDRARSLTDADGRTFAEQSRDAGIDPDHLGPDPDRVDGLAAFVELHVEQGRSLAGVDRPIGIGSTILGHGRWRITILGQGNHAGSTLMHDRRDPMIVAATAVLAIQQIAGRAKDARATVGRLEPVPGGTNVIASRVDLWMDLRHPDDIITTALVAEIGAVVEAAARDSGCSVAIVEESLSPTVAFDAGLIHRLGGVLQDAPVISTGAGHDAGVLASRVPSAMLFVRNPTGVSHSPEEHAEPADLDAGVDALARVLGDLIVTTAA